MNGKKYDKLANEIYEKMKPISLAKQGTYCLDKFVFSSIIPEKSYLFVGVDGNNMDLKMVDKIIDEIRKNAVNVEILYATYYDDTLRDGLFRLNLINIIDSKNDNYNKTCEINITDEDYEKLNDTKINNVFYSNEIIEPDQTDNTVENIKDKECNLNDILKQCKDNNNFSINFIQSITNLGFIECSRIQQKLLKIRDGYL